MLDVENLKKVRSPRKLYVFALLVGVFSGFAALGFAFLLDSLEHLTFHVVAGVDVPRPAGEGTLFDKSATSETRWYLLALLPVVGALISGLLVQFFDESAGGAGTDAMIETFHEKDALVRIRTPLVKTLATLATLAGGGSAGKEGPISQIGSALGSLFARFLDVGPRARRTLFLAGMAGALGAIFRAPLGAAITSVEVLYREDWESDALIPCILASISGYFVFTSVSGFDHIFLIPAYKFTNWSELVFYVCLGLLTYAFGVAFVYFYQGTQSFFERMPFPLFVRTTIGGVGVGLIALISLESIGSGFGFLQKLMSGDVSVPQNALGSLTSWAAGDGPAAAIVFLGGVAVLKILATSLTIGSGGSGGVFGPSLFIGGVLGAFVGVTAHTLFPTLAPSPVPYVVVGMAAFFAGVANAPIASVVMVTELTGSYELLAPLILVAAISLILSRRFSIYQRQKQNKFDSPAHHFDIAKQNLRDITVGEAMSHYIRKTYVDEKTPFRKLLKVAEKMKRTDFIVHGDGLVYRGIFSIRHLPEETIEVYKKKNPKISETAHIQPIPHLGREDALSDALKAFLDWDVDKLPVLGESGALIGFLSFRDMLRSYSARSAERPHDA